MLRARLLLTLFTSVFATLALLAFDSRWHPAFRFFGTGIASLIAVSGLTVLIFTLFKARVAPDGSVCFSKNHPIHWMTMAKLQDGTSLCATTWGTVIPIFFVSAVSFILFAFVFGIVRAVQSGRVVESLLMAGTVIGIVAVLSGVVFLLLYLVNRFGSERFKKVLGYVATGIGISLLLLIVTVGLPAAVQDEAARNDEVLTYGQAAWRAFTYALYFIGSILAVVGVVWGGFTVVPFLAKSGFGRFVKQQFCPVIRTCPVVGDCTPAPQSA